MTVPRTILSVDDSSDDVMLLKLACTAANVRFQFHTVERGEAAIAYLEGLRQFADRERFPLPNLLLLDLKMPGKSGFDVLSWVRSSRRFRHLPVVVFTSSVHVEDRLRALELGADGFVVKPVSYETLQKFVNAIDSLLLADAEPNFRVLEELAKADAAASGIL